MSKPFYQNKKLVRPAAIPIATVNIRSDGGGARKGFGTLLKPEAFDEAAAEKAVKNHIHQIGDVDLDDLRPSISSDEVQPEALKKDYDRTKSFLRAFLKEPQVFVNPFSGKEGEEATPSSSSKKVDKKEEKTKKRKVEDVVACAGKVDELVAVKAKAKKPLKLSISSEAVKRPIAEVDTAGAKVVPPAAEPKAKGPIRSLGSIVASLNGSSAPEPVGADTITMAHRSAVSDSRANVGELKNIFYKGTGVDWEDVKAEPTVNAETTVSNAKVYSSTGGQEAAADPLFREAELVGYDIRGDVDAGAAQGDTFSFGFFQPELVSTDVSDAVDTSASVAVPAVAAAAPSSSAPARAGGKAVGAVKEKEAPEGSRRVQNTMKVPFADRDHDGQPKYYKPVSMPNTLEILKRAKKFCRERSAEAITEEWKGLREKMVLDYKKKRKDALRNIKKRKLQYQYKK